MRTSALLATGLTLAALSATAGCGLFGEDDPADLQVYSAQFGLPAPDLQVIYAQGSEPVCPPGDETKCAGWNSEAALDLQMALTAKGVVIVSTSPGTFAARYGFQQGDVIRSLNGAEIHSVGELVHGLNASGGTILVATHDVAVAARTERRLHMVDGVLAEFARADVGTLRAGWRR